MGTPDATAYESMTGHALVADIKTRGPVPYKQWAEQGAEISHPEAVVQLAAYQAMIEGQGIGDVNASVLLICLDTGAREWDWERIPGDRARAALLAETERLMPLVDALEQVAVFRSVGRSATTNPQGDAYGDALQRRTHPSPRLPRVDAAVQDRAHSPKRADRSKPKSTRLAKTGP